MNQQINHNIKGILIGFFGFTAFTVADTAARALSDAGMASLQINFMASSMSAILAIFLAVKLGGFRATFITPKWKMLWLRGVILGLQGITAVMAFSMIDFVQVYTLIFIAPFMSLLLGRLLLGDEIGWPRLMAIMGGFLGVLIALRPGVIPLETGAVVGLISGFLAALSWVIARRIGNEGQTPLSYVAYPIIFTLIVLSPVMFSLQAKGEFLWPDNYQLWALVALCSVSSFSAILSLTHAFVLAPASVVSPFHYSQLIFGVLWGYLFFNEVPDRWTMIGGVVIMASGLFIAYREYQLHQKMKREAHEPEI